MKHLLTLLTALLLTPLAELYADPVTNGGFNFRHSSQPTAAPEGKKCNILFIAVDDINDRVGCLGDKSQVITASLDRLVLGFEKHSILGFYQ